MNTPPLDALIVGAGPVGLAMASDLLRRGIRCRLIDQLETPHPWSKAQIVHARTLEILETLGVAEALKPKGKFLHGINAYSLPGMKRVFHAPIAPADSLAGSFLSVSQRDTEDCLAGHLERAGGKIERGVRLESFTQDDDGVTASLVLPGGDREEVRAAWLIGCDGAHSAVRHQIGRSFEGFSYEVHIVQADLRVEMPLHIDDDEIVAFLSPEHLLALFPLPGERRYRVLVPLREPLAGEPTLELFQSMLREYGPPGAVASDPAWMVGFRIHCRIVSGYRDRRVFLAGDAAHIHSPAGGQGMNTGIQDAHNLAWKLALVHRGEAHPELLDSYSAERQPVAAHTLALTDRATRGLSTMLTLRHPLVLALRNRLMGFVAQLGLPTEASKEASMLGIGYPDSPIVAQDRPPLREANVLSSASVEAPSLRDWIDFGHGPAPGFRAPDVRLDPERDDSPRLHELLRHGAHTLLLFDGAAHTEAGYANLAAIGRRVRGALGALIDVQIVVPLAEPPAALDWDGGVLLDPRGALHERYGARSECLFLIRPDAHVAYRCQPADGDKLMAYLGRIFVLP